MILRPLLNYALLPVLSTSLVYATMASTLMFVSGCGGSREGNVKASPTLKSIQQSREEIVETKNDIGKTLANLNLLVHQADLKKSFNDFSEGLEDVREHDEDLARQRVKIEENGNEYVMQWQSEMAHFSNDDLKKSSIDRQAAVKNKFAQINSAYKQLDDVFDPFIKNLTEIQMALRNDLTSTSAQSMRPVYQAATAQGENVQAKANELIAHLNDLGSSLSSVPSSATK